MSRGGGECERGMGEDKLHCEGGGLGNTLFGGVRGMRMRMRMWMKIQGLSLGKTFPGPMAAFSSCLITRGHGQVRDVVVDWSNCN